MRTNAAARASVPVAAEKKPSAASVDRLPVLATAYEPPGWNVIALIWFFAGAAAVVGLIMRLAFAGRRPPRH